MFRKTMLAVSMGLVFSMSGCGGGGSDNPPAQITTGTGYYVDSAVSGVKTKCGTKEGTTDASGKFTFEVGKSCTLFLGDIKLRDIDKAILKDGVTVYETDKYTAQVLQSLDSDGNPTNGITISEEFVTALSTANITTLPTNEAERTAMLAVIETAGGTIVTETDAQTHAYTTLISGKDLYTIDIDGDNAQEDIGPITFKADGSLVGASENTWRFDGDKLYLGTGTDYHQIMSVTADYILFKDYDDDDSTTRAYFNEAKARAFMATLSAPNNPPVQSGLTALLAGKTFYKPDLHDGEKSLTTFKYNSDMTSCQVLDETGNLLVTFDINTSGNSYTFSNGRKYTLSSQNSDYVAMMFSENNIDKEIFRFYKNKSKAQSYLNTL